MRNKPKTLFKPLFAAVSILVAGAALADSTADRLTRIEAETLVLKAREKQLAVQAQIAAKEAEIASKQAESNHLARIASAGDPVIRSVEGIGRTVYATLQLDNGSTVDAKVGDILPNGMKVVAINPNEVIVETPKRKRIRLSTGTAAARPYTAAYTGGAMAYPSLPLPAPSAQGFAR